MTADVVLDTFIDFLDRYHDIISDRKSEAARSMIPEPQIPTGGSPSMV